MLRGLADLTAGPSVLVNLQVDGGCTGLLREFVREVHVRHCICVRLINLTVI